MTTLATEARMQCMEVWGGNRAIDRNIQTPGLQVWAFCKPFGQSSFGGDVYYLSSCASGRITRLLLADVSGHGEVVSKVAIALRDLMRRNVNYIKQTRFVTAMNQQFSELSQRGEFATAIVSTFFAPTRKLTICNAGHPPPLLFRKKLGSWSELFHDGKPVEQIFDTPLGIVEEAGYNQHQVYLEPGDMVLLFSDAITESETGDGQQLGPEGLLRLVAKLDVSKPARIIPNLMEQLSRLNESNLQQDDATLLLFQATGDGPSFKANLLAPFRLFGPVTNDTSLSADIAVERPEKYQGSSTSNSPVPTFHPPSAGS